MIVHCRIISQPIDAATLLAEVATPSDGAVLLFWGVVRNENDGREVNGLEYEAYAEMAEAKLREIVAEAAQRWRIGEIAAVHRIGKLNVGEASVGIAVAAPHRAEAYEASRYVIEELKRRVPIWKREHYLDGPSAWLGGSVPAPEVPA
ncbi:MAG: molybdenum cofactor biosynthesis protein MoaE [Gemmatimonadetes bacterium]|nr:molybdenum cofactor biosynthesis protein MoaE [Gemmatimonadota bacterium]